MKSSILKIAVVSMLLASCEKEIIIDVPPHEQKLVINSVSYIGDTIDVSVTKSIDVLKHKSGQSVVVASADVVLKTDDGATASLRYDATRGLYRGSVEAGAFGVYKVQASAAGFSSVEATAKVPTKITIHGVQRIKEARIGADGNMQDEIRLTFDDPAGEKNYYIISVTLTSFGDTFNEFSYVGCVNTVDPSVETIYDEAIDQNTCIESNSIFLRDDLFNGQKKELRLFVNSTDMQAGEMPGIGVVYPTIEIQHVSEEYFRYLKSSRYASINIGNPFAEPTSVYTNVRNGYGIFSIISSELYDIK